MSLRDRLANKTRRVLEQPVLVSDPSEDHQALLQVTAALHLAQGQGDEDAAQRLRAELDAATERVQGHWVPIRLQALPSSDWEAAHAEYNGAEGIDWTRALPPLLAASCVDPELQDEQWWATTLAGDQWSAGDTASLQVALLRLNTEYADPLIPKG